MLGMCTIKLVLTEFSSKIIYNNNKKEERKLSSSSVVVCICMCITVLLSNCTKLEAEGSEVEEDGTV